MPEQLLTLKETAEYLCVTPGALYTQRHRGEKPGALGIRVGRKILKTRGRWIDAFPDYRGNPQWPTIRRRESIRERDRLSVRGVYE